MESLAAMVRFGPQWESPTADYGSDRSTLHVWRASFQPTLVSQRGLVGCLSKEEKKRAERFIRLSDQERYVFSHSVLRSVLAGYLGCEPQQLTFGADRYHKPSLISPVIGSDIQFSLSHSGDMTLIGVSREFTIGVDVELMREVPDALKLVERFFSGDESRYLASLPHMEFDEMFFAYWTAKEAFIKAVGQGLSYPLDKFTVTFLKGESEGLIYTDDINLATAPGWKILRLWPAPGYSGALAVYELTGNPRFFDYRWH